MRTIEEIETTPTESDESESNQIMSLLIPIGIWRMVVSSDIIRNLCDDATSLGTRRNIRLLFSYHSFA